MLLRKDLLWKEVKTTDLKLEDCADRNRQNGRYQCCGSSGQAKQRAELKMNLREGGGYDPEKSAQLLIIARALIGWFEGELYHIMCYEGISYERAAIYEGTAGRLGLEKNIPGTGNRVRGLRYVIRDCLSISCP